MFYDGAHGRRFSFLRGRKRVGSNIVHVPTLIRAIDLLVEDNVGPVGLTGHVVSSAIEAARTRLRTALSVWPVEVTLDVERELAQLTAQQLETLCQGDEAEWPLVSDEATLLVVSLWEEL
jgi:hypothetical protein